MGLLCCHRIPGVALSLRLAFDTLDSLVRLNDPSGIIRSSKSRSIYYGVGLHRGL